MSDKRRKPAAGEPFRPSAAQFRMFVETADRVDEVQRQFAQDSGADLAPSTVLVRNQSGADRRRFHVLGIDDVVFDPSDENQQSQALQTPTFRGVTPEADHAQKFAVLLGPVREGQIGQAVISGGVWCRIVVDDEDDGYRFADVDPGETETLVAVETGTGFILWREGGDGEQWAFLRLSNVAGEAATSGSD